MQQVFASYLDELKKRDQEGRRNSFFGPAAGGGAGGGGMFFKPNVGVLPMKRMGVEEHV